MRPRQISPVEAVALSVILPPDALVTAEIVSVTLGLDRALESVHPSAVAVIEDMVSEVSSQSLKLTVQRIAASSSTKRRGSPVVSRNTFRRTLGPWEETPI